MRSREKNTPVVRADIEKRFRENLNMTIFGAGAMAKAILEVFSRNLVEGATIDLRTVGKFETKLKAARMHHMVTGAANGRMRMTPARRVVRFSPSKKLRARMIAHHEANRGKL